MLPMETSYKLTQLPPYSLHDMRINSMKRQGKDLRLTFESGYLKLEEPCRQVDGDILIQGIDWDFAAVCLRENGTFGECKSRKLSLLNFLTEYPDFFFEVADELYGYNQLRYSGYLSLPNTEELMEMELSIYHTKSIIYRKK